MLVERPGYGLYEGILGVKSDSHRIVALWTNLVVQSFRSNYWEAESKGTQRVPEYVMISKSVWDN